MLSDSMASVWGKSDNIQLFDQNTYWVRSSHAADNCACIVQKSSLMVVEVQSMVIDWFPIDRYNLSALMF
jgi:hypothetical protein